MVGTQLSQQVSFSFLLSSNLGLRNTRVLFEERQQAVQPIFKKIQPLPPLACAQGLAEGLETQADQGGKTGRGGENTGTPQTKRTNTMHYSGCLVVGLHQERAREMERLFKLLRPWLISE